MNAARQRRKNLQERIKKHFLEEGGLAGAVAKAFIDYQKENPEGIKKIGPQIAVAYVYLDDDTVIQATLPTNGATKKIQEMQENGFWHFQEERAMYVPSYRIKHVNIWT